MSIEYQFKSSKEIHWNRWLWRRLPQLAAIQHPNIVRFVGVLQIKQTEINEILTSNQYSSGDSRAGLYRLGSSCANWWSHWSRIPLASVRSLEEDTCRRYYSVWEHNHGWRSLSDIIHQPDSSKVNFPIKLSLVNDLVEVGLE